MGSAVSASRNRIYFLLQRSAHALKKRADAELAASGDMTTAQAAVMVVVSSNGPVSQKHIADTLMQRESAVTTMADRLLKAGYVTRKRSAEDRRAWLLDATPKGREALAAIRKPFQTINAILDHSFRDIDQFALANALKLLLRELNDTPTEL